MKKSDDLQSQIDVKHTRMTELVTAAETRSLTTEENTEFDTLETEIPTLRKEKMREEKFEDIRKVAADKELKRVEEEKRAGNAAGTPGANPNKEEEGVKKDFRYVKFISQMKRGKLEGVYAEMDKEAKRQASDAGQIVKGFGIPAFLAGNDGKNSVRSRFPEKRDLIAGTDTLGGHAVAVETKTLIEFLEDNLILLQAGASLDTGLVGDVEWPREDSSYTATFKGEVAALDEVDPTLDLVTQTPFRLGAFTDVSKQLERQTSWSVENRIRNRIAGAISRTWEASAINGTGSGQPLGILGTSGIGSVVIEDPNGGAIVWDDIVNLVREVEVDNALMGSLKYISNPLVRAELQTTEKASSTAQFILQTATAQLNGFDALFSNLVPSNLSKGASSGILSAMIFGNFTDLALGMWGGLDFTLDEFTQATNGLDRVIVQAYIDSVVLRPQSFAAAQDILTT